MSLRNAKLLQPQIFRMTRLMSSAITKAELEKLTKPAIFRMKLPKNDDYATIEYEENNKEYHFIHTVVPDGYKGQGVGKIIAEKAFDYVVVNDKRMRLSCHFLEKFYQDNKKKYEKFVVV